MFCVPLGFSPDSSLLAAGCGDGAIRVYNSGTGRMVYNLNPPKGGDSDMPTTAIRFRPTMTHSKTRNVLLAFAAQARDVGYCQSLNYVVGTLLLIPLSEAEAYFALGTMVHELMPADYYSADAHILGARIDQLAFAAVLQTQLPALARHLDAHQCPIGLVSIQWCMCLFAKDLPLHVTLRVWDVASGREVASLTGHQGRVWSVCMISPDGSQ